MLAEEPTVYLNGRFLPLSQAHISVMDRGFLFGDGVYEVIPAYGGRPFRVEEHLQRLDSSLMKIRLAPPLSHAQWREILETLLNGAGDQSIYLQVTRGVAAKRDHAFPADCRPTVFAMSTPIPPFSGAQTGVRAVTLDDNRWTRCDIKATTLLANILLRQEAVDRGAVEAILVRDGHVTEGAASNVFVVADGTLSTPPKNHEILPGITRDLILELAEANDLPARECILSVEALRSAKEVWLTSSTREILPVTELNGKPVGEGCPGPLWRQMHGLLQAYKESLRKP